MSGKNKCKILKEIRQKIADENDIAYVTSECKYQGECSGTCPRCEAELQYLENELKKRQQKGIRIALAGVAAAVVVSAGGCVAVRQAEKAVEKFLNSQTQGMVAALDNDFQ